MIGLAYAKPHRQKSKCCVGIDLTLLMLRCSASNPTIDKLPDWAVRSFSDNSISLARFLFWTISNVFMQLGDYSPCVGTFENCRFHDPDQRATTCIPCSSVSRGELNLGQA